MGQRDARKCRGGITPQVKCEDWEKLRASLQKTNIEKWVATSWDPDREPVRVSLLHLNLGNTVKMERGCLSLII